jgi:F-box interacting protein
MEKNSTREIPRDMLREILVKLPAKDVARSGCVSRLWLSVVSDPFFRNLHAMASHVTSARTEALLVTERRVPGPNDEATVFNVSSGKAMCRVPIPSSYTIANVCNGFLCFAHPDGPAASVVVCNPVTGEAVRLPKAPPVVSSKVHLFALGFSPSTKEYKLFRLSTYPWSSSISDQRVEVDVHTLGDTRGWRCRDSFTSPCRPANVSAPVSIDGKIYVLTLSWTHGTKHENPKRLLAIDVAAESCCTYHLPDYETWPYEDPTVGAFELNGRLCFVAHILNLIDTAITIHFWVMSPPPGNMDLEGHHQQPSWDLRYSFRTEHNYCFSTPWACWLEEDEMLCYMQYEILHLYGGTGEVTSTSNSGFLRWDKELQLPDAPLRSECQFNIYGGYRPTLLSPLIFAVPPVQDDDDTNKHQFEHNMLRVLRHHR